MYVFCGECAHFDVCSDLSVYAGYFGKCEFLNLKHELFAYMLILCSCSCECDCCVSYQVGHTELLFHICGYTVFCNILLLVTHILKFLILISVQ